MSEEQQKIKQYKFSFRTDKVTYDRVKKTFRNKQRNRLKNHQ